MEFLYELGFYVGFFTLLGILGWAVKRIGEFVETRRYKSKLEKLGCQLEVITTEKLSSEVSAIKKRYSRLMNLLARKYKVRMEDEQVKSIHEYIQEEVNYRRAKRRPASKTHRRKYRRYRRFY